MQMMGNVAGTRVTILGLGDGPIPICPPGRTATFNRLLGRYTCQADHRASGPPTMFTCPPGSHPFKPPGISDWICVSDARTGSKTIPSYHRVALNGFGDITPNAVDPMTGWKVDPTTGFPIDPTTGNPTSPSLLKASVSTIFVPDPVTSQPVEVPAITTTNTDTGATTTVAVVTDPVTKEEVSVPVATTPASKIPTWLWAVGGTALAFLLLRR